MGEQHEAHTPLGDAMQFAAIIAHQIQSPLSGVSTILSTMLGGYAGPLDSKQRDMLRRTHDRCSEAVEAVQRILVIARMVDDPTVAKGYCDALQVVHHVKSRFEQEAQGKDIRFWVEANAPDAWVACSAEALTEVFHSLFSNAFKYTPNHGKVTVFVEANGPEEPVIFRVCDSGAGIPEAERAHIFKPFYRSSNALASSRTGVGLGLSFVRGLVEAAGGAIEAEQSEFGGAELRVELPAADSSAVHQQGEEDMAERMKVVIIGGVAAGPKVASKIMRLDPNADVTVVEKGEFLSYAGCGLPYYVSGVVKEQKELMATPVGVVRDPVFFQQVKNFHVLNRTEAIQVDREKKQVHVRDLPSGNESALPYDKLVFATGASPIMPPLPGSKRPGVFALHGVHDAEGIKHLLSKTRAHDVVIIGGGLIGVEATEALVHCGCRVTVVEMLPNILPMLDKDMARLVELHMESHGVKVMTGTRAEVIEGDGEDGHVTAVKTDKGTIAAEMVIMSVGVRPSSMLAKDAGLEVNDKIGTIVVDDHMRTSDPDIYAAGDCVQSKNLLTGRPVFVPLGSTANKQGRVAAVNICGGDDTFPGVLGSTICKVFDYCVGRTGLTEREALAEGYDVITAMSPAPDKAHYYPEAKLLMMKLIADKKSRKLLGLQVTGPGNGDKRIDVAAMAITAGLTVDQLAKADLCYAPPYSPAMDNIITACDVARNKLDGIMEGITAEQVCEKIRRRDDFILLDARSPGEYEQMHLPESINIPLGALRPRLNELPKDKEIVAFCKISLRGYEAALILKGAGFKNVKVLDGGIAMWPYDKVE